MKLDSRISRILLGSFTALLLVIFFLYPKPPANETIKPTITAKLPAANSVAVREKSQWQGKLNNKRQKTGLWTLSADNGAVITVAHYAKGQLHGAYTTYYPSLNVQSRKIKIQTHYHKGQIHGAYTAHYNNNKNTISTQGHYDKGQKIKAWSLWTRSQHLIGVSHYEKGLKHGIQKSYVNTFVYQISRYRKGLLHGIWQTFTINKAHKVTQSGLYQDGKQQGLWKTWTSDGSQLRQTAFYQDNFLHGKMTQYNENGLKWKVWNYTKNRREGPFTEYFPVKRNRKNQVFEKGQYSSDARTGLWVTQYNSGKTWKRTPYKANQIHGITKQYYNNGRLWKKIEYKNNKMNGAYVLYNNVSNSPQLLTGQYKNGHRHGKWILWYPDGKSINRIIHYNNGSKHGLATRYYPSGREWIRSRYNTDALNGLHVEFHDNFKKSKKVVGRYDKDKRTGKWTYWTRLGKLNKTETY